MAPACTKQGLRSNHRIHIQLHLATDRLLAYCDPGHIFSGLYLHLSLISLVRDVQKGDSMMAIAHSYDVRTIRFYF